jgi:hypothetical protein
LNFTNLKKEHSPLESAQYCLHTVPVQFHSQRYHHEMSNVRSSLSQCHCQRSSPISRKIFDWDYQKREFNLIDIHFELASCNVIHKRDLTILERQRDDDGQNKLLQINVVKNFVLYYQSYEF